MIRKSMILLFLIILTIIANGRNINSKYLKNGIGTYLVGDNIGPALKIEYGKSLNKNLYLVPRILISSVINEYENSESEDYYSYYDFGLGLHYELSSIGRMKIGLGAGTQVMRRIYLHEYEDVSDNVVSNIASSFDAFGIVYGSIGYAIIQKKTFDIGIDGSIQFGKENSYAATIYIKFKS